MGRLDRRPWPFAHLRRLETGAGAPYDFGDPAAPGQDPARAEEAPPAKAP